MSEDIKKVKYCKHGLPQEWCSNCNPSENTTLKTLTKKEINDKINKSIISSLK